MLDVVEVLRTGHMYAQVAGSQWLYMGLSLLVMLTVLTVLTLQTCSSHG